MAVVVFVLVGGGFAGWLGTRAGLPCGQRNILLLELAGSAARSRAVLASTAAGSCRVSQINRSLVADVWFIVVYVLVLAFGVWWFGRNGYRIRALRGRAPGRIAMLVVLMGLLDLVEDASLRAGLAGGDKQLYVRNAWAAIATTASWGKWALAVVVAAYLVGALVGFVAMPRFVRDALYSASSAKPKGPVLRPSRKQSVANQLGISLSGGGVRSASFSLGLLQALEYDDPDHPDRPEPPISWKRARKLTAVSGGAYMAGAMTLARTGRAPAGPAPLAKVEPPAVIPPGTHPTPWATDVQGGSGDDSNGPSAVESPEERHFRDNLGYILSGRAGAAGAVSTLVLGLIVNASVLLLTLWLVAVPIGRLEGSCVVEPSLSVPNTAAHTTHHAIARCPWTIASARTFNLAHGQWVPPVLWLGAGLFLLVWWVLFGRLAAVSVPWVSRAARWVSHAIQTPAFVLLGIGAVLAVVLVALPWLMVEISDGFKSAGGTNGGSWPGAQLFQGIVAIGAATGLTATIKTTLETGVQKRLTRLGGVLLVLLAVLIGGNWAAHAAQLSTFTGRPAQHYAIGVALLAVAWLLVSPEWWALGPAYRARLRRAYATWRPTPEWHQAFAYGGAADPPPPKDADAAALAEAAGKGQLPPEPSLYQLAGGHETGAYPETIICATLNVSGRDAYVHHGIPAFSFTMSPESVSFFEPTSDDRATRVSCQPATLEELSNRWGGSRFTVMSSVALAGAAVSSAMGRQSMGNTDAVLAFANIRLGAWMPNPRFAKELETERNEEDSPSPPTRRQAYPKVSLTYLFKELLGIYDVDDLYVYVTDGGHWENTGLAELVRPVAEPDTEAFSRDELTELICVDASGVSIESVTSLAEAIGLARLECDADIRVRFDSLRATDATTKTRYASRCATIGFVRRWDDLFSVLWYAKPVLTQGDPTSLLAYAERDRTYPAVGTIDQFFDEEHFVAYRDIGRYAAGQILTARTELTRLRQFDHPSLQSQAGESWVAAEICALVDAQEWESIRANWPLI